MLLAAGKGSRLQPLTNTWPKCLMPVHGVPILEYWLVQMHNLSIKDVLVNLHHLAPEVENFLSRPKFKDWVTAIYEQELAGTAGALRNNFKFFSGSTVLLVHADNWSQCNFSDFINFHFNRRPQNCPITMMTFDCLNPRSCGIVKTNNQGIVKEFYEKQENPPGRIANGAVYLIEPEVIELICKDQTIYDFSTHVIPKYMNRIATWHNSGVHRDIGTYKDLCEVQNYPPSPFLFSHNLISADDSWSELFEKHQIHNKIKKKEKE
jgi:mannose-1-phosphate guanylyltransferase